MIRRTFLVLMIFLVVGAIPCNRPNRGENIVSPLQINICFAATKNLTLEAKAKNALNNLINFYSKDDLDNFIANVDLNFSDSRGYTIADLAASLKDDFRNFQDINLYITGVKEQIVLNDNSRVTLTIEWNRSITIPTTAQMWLSRGITSLTFIKTKNEELRLYEITGDLIFALANYQGIIVLDRGTLDGKEISTPLMLKEGKFI